MEKNKDINCVNCPNHYVEYENRTTSLDICGLAKQFGGVHVLCKFKTIGDIRNQIKYRHYSLNHRPPWCPIFDEYKLLNKLNNGSK